MMNETGIIGAKILYANNATIHRLHGHKGHEQYKCEQMAARCPKRRIAEIARRSTSLANQDI